jgi:hypothetical protein
MFLPNLQKIKNSDRAHRRLQQAATQVRGGRQLGFHAQRQGYIGA